MKPTVVVVLVLACSSAPEPTEEVEYRPCALGSRVGEFAVELAEAGFTSVSGHVASGVVPSEVAELVRAAGDCRLLRKRNLFCDPPCSSAETCGEDRKCLPFPFNKPVGTVTVTGLARPVRMTATTSGMYFDTTLPARGFAPGANIRLTADGGPFTLRGTGVAPLELPAQTFALESGAPFPISWKPSQWGRIAITLNVDQHSTTPATLLCDLPDSGSASLPADLVSDLLQSGTSGYPTLTLSRRTADSVTFGPGCVELIVSARISRAVQVRGHTPCMRDADCPAGATCDRALQSCR